MAEAIVPCPAPFMPVPYGCYCGITLTDPHRPPVDAFDGLCQRHDRCYGRVEKDIAGCKGAINEYLAPYNWNMEYGKVRRSGGGSISPSPSLCDQIRHLRYFCIVEICFITSRHRCRLDYALSRAADLLSFCAARLGICLVHKLCCVLLFQITCRHGQSECFLRLCDCDRVLVTAVAEEMAKSKVCPKENPGCH